MKKELGLIGFGNFGQFMVKHLLPFFDITVYNRTPLEEKARELGVKTASLKETVSKKIIIISIPVQNFEKLMLEVKDTINPNALVLDVSSVKVKPIQLMEKHLPETCEIIGTHPLFGPQSGAKGIENLNVFVCSVRTTKNEKVKNFLSEKLKLKVIECLPEEHDKKMAFIQALTHFIGKGLIEENIPKFIETTNAYNSLLNLCSLVLNDSDALFETIQKENPFAKEIREKFIEKLKEIEKRLNSS